MVPSKKTVSMEIQYETYGIPQDCEKQKFSINNVSDHVLCGSDCLAYINNNTNH